VAHDAHRLAILARHEDCDVVRRRRSIVIDLASSPQTHEEQMRKLRQDVTGEERELMQCLVSEVNRVGNHFDRLHSLVCKR
jgi:ribosomal protein L36